MTPAQVLTTVRAQAYETSEGFWNDSEIFSYMWQCEQDIATELGCAQGTDSSTTTVASTQEYAKPSDCAIINRLVWDSVKLKKVDLTDQDAMDWQGYGSSITTGQPYAYWEFGANVGLYPIPDSAKTLKFWYTKIPAEVTSASTAFTIEQIFHTCFVDYCLWRMYAKDQDDGRMSFHYGNYQRLFLSAKLKWARRVGADQHQVVRDEMYFPTTELGLI